MNLVSLNFFLAGKNSCSYIFAYFPISPCWHPREIVSVKFNKNYTIEKLTNPDFIICKLQLSDVNILLPVAIQTYIVYER
jgi:hypothetical protein